MKKSGAQLTQEALRAIRSGDATGAGGRAGQDPRQLANEALQAITTTYKGPGARGSRIIARCSGRRISVPYDHALDGPANHAAAAIQLQEQMGWSDRHRLVMGGVDGEYVFVQVPRR